MSDTKIRLIDVGDADASAAHRARDADAFAWWEPSRPADFYTQTGTAADRAVARRASQRRRWKLARSRGDLIAWGRWSPGGVHIAEFTSAGSAGVPGQMVELVRSGRTPEELAREFEPSAHAIRSV